MTNWRHSFGFGSLKKKINEIKQNKTSRTNFGFLVSKFPRTYLYPCLQGQLMEQDASSQQQKQQPR